MKLCARSARLLISDRKLQLKEKAWKDIEEEIRNRCILLQQRGSVRFSNIVDGVHTLNTLRSLGYSAGLTKEANTFIISMDWSKDE